MAAIPPRAELSPCQSHSASLTPSCCDRSLAGQTAFITGAGRGIGRHIALAFARAGANVACISRTKEELDSLIAEITARYSSPTLGIAADITHSENVTEAIIQINHQFGHIDILVNNAGIARFDTIQYNFDFDIWSRIIDVNLRAPVDLTRQVLPGMLARHHGTIISIGSRNGIENVPYMSAYSTSKTGLLRFHQCLELEIQGSGVFNYYVQPGNIATALIDSSDAIDLDAARTIPRLRHMIQKTMDTSKTSPEKPANLCVTLASEPDARLLSGLYIDAELGLEPMLNELKLRTGGRVTREKLYQLRLDQL